VRRKATEGKQVFAAAVSQPAEVTKAREAFGQDRLQEAALELFDGKGHEALLAAMSVVLPSEGHVRVGDGEDAVMGDGDAVSRAGGSADDL
jgi:hypothetical protein